MSNVEKHLNVHCGLLALAEDRSESGSEISDCARGELRIGVVKVRRKSAMRVCGLRYIVEVWLVCFFGELGIWEGLGG